MLNKHYNNKQLAKGEMVKGIRTLIVSLGAKNIHKSLAPWCIKAYCDSRGIEADVQESCINENLNGIISEIYQRKPDIVGFSCYIWNIEHVVKITNTLKKLIPSCVIILGGPEVSFEHDLSSYPYADYIIQGTGEVVFYELLQAISTGKEPDTKVIAGGNCEFKDFPSPYTDAFFESFAKSKMLSIANQLVYYESSRGCPFSCAYCLSSATHGVQYLPLDRVKDDLVRLLSHGAKCIKFVDRTFNADKRRAIEILEFIRSLDTDCTFHFEVAADLFDDEMLQVIAKIPPARVQFEIGIQSVNPKTLDAVSRKTDINKALANIKTLVDMGNCHVHVDLIAGLPQDTLDTFAEGIDRVLSVRPHMLQLGFLKMLKGSEMRSTSKNYVYADYPPYEVLQSDSLSFGDIITLKGIEEVIDKFYNSGMYAGTIHYAMDKLFPSWYELFSKLAAYCIDNGGTKVSLKNSYSLLLSFLLDYGDKSEVEHHIKLDCLSHDAKGQLPDSITSNRDRAAEAEYKKHNAYKNVRVEHFDYDATKRVFIYESKNLVSNSYMVEIIG